MTAAPPDRAHDLVLFGATGFVGRLTAGYLARSAPAGVRVALAGRSQQRLELLRAALPTEAADWPLLVADTGDAPTMTALARSTRVVATTVGPYARHGRPLVEACAAVGTSYADLTGEVLFVRDSIDRAHETAAASGARIVHACGFDSVPSDVGLLLAAERARQDGAGEVSDATLLLVSARGGLSGGTIESLRVQVDAAKGDPAKRLLLFDPYALSPDRTSEPDLGPQRDTFLARREEGLDGRWVAPFVMASFNTRIVRRSNALQGWAYGHRMRYREMMGAGRSSLAPLFAAGTAVAAGAVAAGLARAPTRALLDRVLPAPGEGPGEKARAAGHFSTWTTVTTTSGVRYRTTFRARGDPGYAATSVMLGESALALVLDDLPQASGVLTPATGIGAVLADRLRAAAFTIEVDRLG